ncbi:hypothetical protein ACGFX2_36780 [Streptomyces goshikiensis]|uniref:hypothetical protein n=1 Tax=Streptomyces goshikiensis TaxID=1942 RepID=UPI003711CE12
MGLPRRLHALIVALLFALITVPAGAGAGRAIAAPARHAIPIADARQLPLGSVVTVEGAVTTPSGAFQSSFFDNGFGLQDGTAGIYVSLQTDPHAAPYQRASVTGTLRERDGLLTVVPAAPSDVRLGGPCEPVRPERVRTGEVGEDTEGRLVTVVATVTQAPVDDLPYGYKVSVDDGSGELLIFVNVQTGIDVSGLAPGDRVRVTGFSSQFGAHYEIDPRSPHDIEPARRAGGSAP